MAPSSSQGTGPAAVTSLPLAVFGVILVCLGFFAASIVYLQRRKSEPRREKTGQQFSIDVSIDVYTVLSERDDSKISEGSRHEDAVVALPCVDTSLPETPAVRSSLRLYVRERLDKLSAPGRASVTRGSPVSPSDHHNDLPQADPSAISSTPLCSVHRNSLRAPTCSVYSLDDAVDTNRLAYTVTSTAPSIVNYSSSPHNIRCQQGSSFVRLSCDDSSIIPALRDLDASSVVLQEDMTFVSNPSFSRVERSDSELPLLLPQVTGSKQNGSNKACLDDQVHPSEEDICYQFELQSAHQTPAIWQRKEDVCRPAQEPGRHAVQLSPESSWSLANVWSHSPLLSTSLASLQNDSTPSSPSSPRSLDLGTLHYPETPIISVQFTDSDIFNLPEFSEEAFIYESTYALGKDTLADLFPDALNEALLSPKQRSNTPTTFAIEFDALLSQRLLDESFPSSASPTPILATLSSNPAISLDPANSLDISQVARVLQPLFESTDVIFGNTNGTQASGPSTCHCVSTSIASLASAFSLPDVCDTPSQTVVRPATPTSGSFAHSQEISSPSLQQFSPSITVCTSTPSFMSPFKRPSAPTPGSSISVLSP